MRSFSGGWTSLRGGVYDDMVSPVVARAEPWKGVLGDFVAAYGRHDCSLQKNSVRTHLGAIDGGEIDGGSCLAYVSGKDVGD